MTEKQNAKPDPERREVIIGLDFGTSHTGISLAFTETDEVFHVEEWPDARGSPLTTRSPKTPTLIAYPPMTGGTRHEKSAQPAWGYEIDSQKSICAWMKYHLDQNSSLTEYDEPNLATAIRDGLFSVAEAKTAEKVSEDYLKEVIACALRHLKRYSGDDLLNLTTVQWWLARPAIWGPQAMSRLQGVVEKAAAKAGFCRPRGRDKHHFLTEAEAAAYALLEQAVAYGEIEAGEAVMICDCGGGTVDVAVVRLTSKDPLVIGDVVPGKGGKCGSACIDLEFDRFMQRRFGAAYEKVDPAEKRFGSAFMKEFELRKHCFNGTAAKGNDDLDQPYEMVLFMDVDEDVPDEWYDKRDHRVKVTKSEMAEIFEPTIARVMKLLTKQYEAAGKRTSMDSAVKKIMLTGGFARSPYLHSRVEKWCAGKDIQLVDLEVDISWGAVARGAVLRGLDIARTDSVLSRFHSGVRCALPYEADHDADHLQDVFEHRIYGDLYVRNAIRWYSKKGTEINHYSLKTAWYSITLEPDTPKFSVHLVCCGEDEPPRHCSNDAVQDVGTLKVRLSKVELEDYRVPLYQSERGTAINFRYRIEETAGASKGTTIFRALTEDDVHLGEVELVLPKLGRSRA